MQGERSTRAFGAFTIGLGPLFSATASVAVPCLHRTRAVSYIAVLSNRTCMYRVHPCTAWLHCNGPAEVVTATLYVIGACGEVLYSTVPHRARGRKCKPNTHVQINKAFLSRTTITTPHLSTLSFTLFSTLPLTLDPPSVRDTHRSV